MKEKCKFKDIDKARKILGLDEEATLYEIRDRFYKLSKMYHPDKSGKNTEEKFKEISGAYKLLMDYASSYRISFRKKDVDKMCMDRITYKHLKQFYDQWWGDLEI